MGSPSLQSNAASGTYDLVVSVSDTSSGASLGAIAIPTTAPFLEWCALFHQSPWAKRLSATT